MSPITWHGSSAHWHSCRGQSFSGTTEVGPPWPTFLKKTHNCNATKSISIRSMPKLRLSPSTEMSWMAKRRMIVQIIPRVIFTFPSTISERETSITVNKLWTSAQRDDRAGIYKKIPSGRGEILIPSAPIETSFTPLLEINSKALLTLAILWKRIFPLSGLGNLSPDKERQT